MQKGSGYRVWVATEQDKGLHEVQWSNGTRVYAMFEEHKWIEPGESIFDEVRLIPLPANFIAAKVEARLLAQVKRFPRKKNTEWNSSAIAGPVIISEGGCMDRDVKQQRENPRRTNEWERDKRDDRDDRDRMQREEDPQKTKDWERDKGDTTK